MVEGGSPNTGGGGGLGGSSVAVRPEVGDEAEILGCLGRVSGSGGFGGGGAFTFGRRLLQRHRCRWVIWRGRWPSEAILDMQADCAMKKRKGGGGGVGQNGARVWVRVKWSLSWILSGFWSKGI
jgi:hypothetical protein